MKRALLGIASLGIVLAACSGQSLDGGSANGSELFVRQALAPDQKRTNKDVCTYVPDSKAPSLMEGTLDIAVRDDYVVPLLLQVGQVKTGVQLESAHVRVLETADGPVIGEHDVVITGFVEAGGFGVTILTGLNAAEGEKIKSDLIPETSAVTRTKVIIEVSVKGSPAAGGVPSTTPVFRFPVTVCKGCLVSFASADDPATPQRECSMALGENERLPCFVGQDEVTPCQPCQDRPICRPL